MGSAARFTAPPYAPLQRLRRTISVAKMLDNTQSIICAFCLAAGTPRTPYQCVESCGAALIYPASLPLRFRQDKFSKRPHCDAADPRREEVASAEILQQKQNFLTPMGLLKKRERGLLKKAWRKRLIPRRCAAGTQWGTGGYTVHGMQGTGVCLSKATPGKRGENPAQTPRAGRKHRAGYGFWQAGGKLYRRARTRVSAYFR